MIINPIVEGGTEMKGIGDFSVLSGVSLDTHGVEANHAYLRVPRIQIRRILYASETAIELRQGKEGDMSLPLPGQGSREN